jgi:hypothetical protein
MRRFIPARMGEKRNVRVYRILVGKPEGKKIGWDE